MSGQNPRTRRRVAASNRARLAAGDPELSDHARQRAAELGFHEVEVYACIANPETVYPGAPSHGPGRLVYRRGGCACVIAEASRVVVTVLLTLQRDWVHGVDTRAS